MVYKYFVNCEVGTFGMMYNLETKLVGIGGHFSMLDIMSTLIVEGFKKNLPAMEKVQPTKIRFVFKYETKDFFNTIKELENSGIVIVATKKLGRVMI